MDDDKFCLSWHDCAECASCDGFNEKCRDYECRETRGAELKKLIDSFKK